MEMIWNLIFIDRFWKLGLGSTVQKTYNSLNINTFRKMWCCLSIQQLACLNIDVLVSSEFKEVQWAPFRALNRWAWFSALVSATSITLCSVWKIPPRSGTHSLARLVFEVPPSPWCPPGHDPVAKRKVISHKPCDAQWCWFIAREPANSRRAFKNVVCFNEKEITIQNPLFTLLICRIPV